MAAESSRRLRLIAHCDSCPRKPIAADPADESACCRRDCTDGARCDGLSAHSAPAVSNEPLNRASSSRRLRTPVFAKIDFR